MSQLATKAPTTIRELINAQLPAIAMALGGSTSQERKLRSERFARVCLTAIGKDRNLERCTIPSFAAAMMTCAQLNLEPNTPQGLAYLIPYGTECQFQLGYRGMIQLMYRSGMVASFNADVVYKAEVEAGTFSYTSGTTRTIHHEIDLLQPQLRQGEIVAAYACCTLKSGQTITRLVDAAEIERARQKSGGRRGPSKVWDEHFAAMAMKTAIKRLAAWMPQTEILSEALEKEGGEEAPQQIEPAVHQTQEERTAALNAMLASGYDDEATAIDVNTRSTEAVEAVNSDTGEVLNSTAQQDDPCAPGLCPKESEEMHPFASFCARCASRSGCPAWED